MIETLLEQGWEAHLSVNDLSVLVFHITLKEIMCCRNIFLIQQQLTSPHLSLHE